MSIRRKHLLSGAVLTAVIAALGWVVIDHWREPPPGRYDAAQRSRNLPRDLRRMWETKPLDGHASHVGPNPRSSTDRAINAASRVFNSVELTGMTRADAIALLGVPRTTGDSVYNFPFWPAPPGALVYRFDSGAYGRQFNLLTDDQDMIKTVERRWIH